LSELEKNGLVENSRVMGEFMKNELLNLKPYITKVTGRGLYLGVHFSEDIKSR
jgi:4-aminobutyrate aminotransferase-like enzyme